VKKRLNRAPLANTKDKADSPYDSLRRSRSSSGLSRVSRYTQVKSPEKGTVRKDSGFSFSEPINTTPSPIPITKPRILQSEPSGETKYATTSIDSVISLLRRLPASVDEISFLLIARDRGVEEAVFWARELEISYEFALRQLISQTSKLGP